MPIVRLLQEAAFQPDEIQVIAHAYEETCKILQLVDRDDPLMALVAKKVLEIAQSGERDARVITLRAVKELLGTTD